MPIRPENRDRYPDDWPEISYRIRTERAKGRCECVGECDTEHGGRCTAENGQAHPVTGSKVVLTTAHRDHIPEHVDDANLFAACQRCHLRYDREHHRQTAAATRRAAVEAAGQLALALPPAPTPPATHLRVDEIGIALHAPRETRQWWELFRRRMPDRITTVAVRMPGDLVDIACTDRAHAEWLHGEFRRRGVPSASLKVSGTPS